MQNGDPCNIGGATDPGCITWPNLFNMSTGDATTIMHSLVQEYQTASAVPQPNGSFVGKTLEPSAAYAGPYKTSVFHPVQWWSGSMSLSPGFC